MHNDDAQLGQILSRREALLALGAAGVAMLSGCSSSAERSTANDTLQAAVGGSLPACVVRPAQTEGPYFVDEKLNRSDIRTDPTNDSLKTGVPLELVFHVSRINGSSCE